jgi:hypothetical protein
LTALVIIDLLYYELVIVYYYLMLNYSVHKYPGHFNIVGTRYISFFIYIFVNFIFSYVDAYIIRLFRIISIPSKFCYFRLPDQVISMECLALNFRCQCTQQKLQSICAVLTFDPQLTSRHEKDGMWSELTWFETTVLLYYILMYFLCNYVYSIWE